MLGFEGNASRISAPAGCILLRCLFGGVFSLTLVYKALVTVCNRFPCGCTRKITKEREKKKHNLSSREVEGGGEVDPDSGPNPSTDIRSVISLLGEMVPLRSENSSLYCEPQVT